MGLVQNKLLFFSQNQFKNIELGQWEINTTQQWANINGGIISSYYNILT